MGRSNNDATAIDYSNLSGDAALYAQAYTEEIDKMADVAKYMGITAAALTGVTVILYAWGRSRLR